MNTIMTKIVNINTRDYDVYINGMKVRGFISKIELDINEIRKLITSGCLVYEIIPGLKPIPLTLSNYNKTFKPIVISEKEKPKTDFFVKNNKLNSEKNKDIKSSVKNDTENDSEIKNK